MNSTNIAPVPASRKSSPARTPRRVVPAAAVVAPAFRTQRSVASTLSALADRLHDAVTSLTIALEAGDVGAARIARNALNAARVDLDVVSMIGSAS